MSEFLKTKILPHIDTAKRNFISSFSNNKLFAKYYLYILIAFIIFLTAIYIKYTINLKNTNNNNMMYNYDSRNTKISGIDGKSTQKYKLRDYYVASSYNSCCGGNAFKDFVDMVPLKYVIRQGARWLDFEIYSIQSEPIVAAGPDPTPNGKYCLKGTYNSLSFEKVMNEVNMCAFTGAIAPNPDDPLFLSFRIKTNNKNIYDNMARVINKIFTGKFLSPIYGWNGKDLKLTTAPSLQKIPLMNLKQKVIIFVDDPNRNWKGTKFEEYINMTGNNPTNKSSTIYTYRNIDILQTYNKKSMEDQNKEYLAVSMPDFSKITTNSAAAIHRLNGVQFILMNYALLDSHMEDYLDFFNDNGSAFVLKPYVLRYHETVIDVPKKQLKQLSYETKKMNLLNGAYRPGM